MSPSKVLVIYPYLQHYRADVFHHMDLTSGIEYSFLSDIVGREGIKTLPPENVSRHQVVPRKEFGPFYWQKGVVSSLLRNDYDAVIFFAEIPALSTWIGAITARLRGKPVLFWTTGWHRPERGIKRIIRNSFYRLSNELLLYGELGKSIGQKMKFPVRKMTVIGNSVETALSDQSESEIFTFQKKPGTLVVGAVIRLIPVKKLELIIRAAAILLKDKELPELVVLIVGEGPEREAIEQLAHELGIELVMPGAIYGVTALKQVYEFLDITIVPAAVGLTAIQSMTHGVPVISNDSAYTQMPEWESINPGITGELFTEDDADSLAQAIRRIAGLSEQERAIMARACKKEVAENWAAEAHAARIAKAVRRILSLQS